MFGGFLENMGRAVYQDVFDPTSVHADVDGYRIGVMSTFRRLSMTDVHYPGAQAVPYRVIDTEAEPSEAKFNS